MNKEDIRIKHIIVHILDSTIGMPVLSDTELEFGSEVAEFVREHIGRICAGDDAKECRFYERESEIYKLLTAYDDEDFVAVSQEIAGLLYEIMAQNIDIPSADLMAVRFKEGEEEYLALLKLNFKALYTHRTMLLAGGDGNSNELIRHKSISFADAASDRGGGDQALRPRAVGSGEKVRGKRGEDELLFFPVLKMQRASFPQGQALHRGKGCGECAEGRL